MSKGTCKICKWWSAGKVEKNSYRKNFIVGKKVCYETQRGLCQRFPDWVKKLSGHWCGEFGCKEMEVENNV